jgi:hypothetical protein
MTWIKTVPIAEASDRLRELMMKAHELYPSEYNGPVAAAGDPADDAASIVASHTLIPDALYHAFSTFGVLMSPELPLSRRQHEIITTMVSVTNRCHY